MDADLILDKLVSLARCVQRLEDKRPAQLDILLEDADTQDILALNLERAVQLCVDIGAHVLAEHREPAPETMGDVFLSLEKLAVLDAQLAAELRKAVGLRNASVHAYASIDWGIVYDVVHRRLHVFRAFAAAIRKLLPR